MVFATGTPAGVGLVASTLALSLTTDRIGALNVVVSVDDENMEGVAAAHGTLGDLGGNFHSVLVLDCRWFSNHALKI